MPAVLIIKERAVSAMLEVAVEVQLPVGPPLLVIFRQRLDVQPLSDTLEDKIELLALSRRERTIEHAMCSLGVIDEHVEHVSESPIGNTLAALALDRFVDRVDSGERLFSYFSFRKHDLLRVANRGEQTPDRIGWVVAGEEEPVDRAVQGELGGRAGEDQQDQLCVSPDLSDD